MGALGLATSRAADVGRPRVDWHDQESWSAGVVDRFRGDAAGLPGAGLRKAIDFCRLQPVVAADAQSRIGMELLAGGLSCPTLDLDDWRGWYRKLADGLVADFQNEHGTLFINVSNRQLCDPRIYLDLSRLPAPHRIVIEWIEERSCDPDSSEQAQEHLARLRAQGFRIAVDDVGAGEDGIGRSLQMRPEFAKLDGRLLRSCRSLGNGDGASGAQFLVGMRMALEAIGCRIIAEWVETEDDLTLIRDAGIEFAQGRLFPTRVVSCRYRE